MNIVSLRDEVRKHFSSPGRVPCAFTIDSIEDFGHGPKGPSIQRVRRSRQEVERLLSLNEYAAERGTWGFVNWKTLALPSKNPSPSLCSG